VVFTLKVIRVFRGPGALARSFTGFTARRLAAVELFLGVATIGEEETLAAGAAPFKGEFHDPEPPGA